MKIQHLSTDKITVPEYVTRPLAKVPDSRDTESIRKHGIQQPLVLVADGDRWLLADGLRRLRIAKALGIGKVPYVEAPVPDGVTVEAYVRELRLCLDIHRADLTPSQKCTQMLDLKQRLGMKNKELAVYFGVDPDTVTNVLSVRRYIPEVVAALDSGKMTMRVARAFDGMTEHGQRHVWDEHGADLMGPGKYNAPQQLRKIYPPEENPDFYAKPELVAKRLRRKFIPLIHRKGIQKGQQRAVTTEEKRRLMSSVELREIELKEGSEEEKRMKVEITVSIAPLAAILRSEKLVAMVPPDMKEELDRFAEIYI